MDRAGNKFNKVATRIDNKVDDLLRSEAEKADDGLNAINKARYNIRKSLGLEPEYSPAGMGHIDSSPEETSHFKDQISKITEKGKSSSNKKINNGSEGAGKAGSFEWQSYFDDIENNTGRKLTQEQKDLVIQEINNNPHNTKLRGQLYKDHRRDFNNQKDDLIS